MTTYTDADCLALGFDRAKFLQTPPSTSFDKCEETYLYVFRCEQYAKVGIAKDWRYRLEQFKAGNPFEIKVDRTIKYRSRLHALLVERTIHGVLEDARYYGEWFICPKERVMPVVYAVHAAMRQLDQIHKTELARREEAYRVRYETNEKYRAKVDREAANNERWLALHNERERLAAEATREIDEQLARTYDTRR